MYVVAGGAAPDLSVAGEGTRPIAVLGNCSECASCATLTEWGGEKEISSSASQRICSEHVQFYCERGKNAMRH